MHIVADTLNGSGDKCNRQFLDNAWIPLHCHSSRHQIEESRFPLSHYSDTSLLVAHRPCSARPVSNRMKVNIFKIFKNSIISNNLIIIMVIKEADII